MQQNAVSSRFQLALLLSGRASFRPGRLGRSLVGHCLRRWLQYQSQFRRSARRYQCTPPRNPSLRQVQGKLFPCQNEKSLLSESETASVSSGVSIGGILSVHGKRRAVSEREEREDG